MELLCIIILATVLWVGHVVNENIKIAIKNQHELHDEIKEIRSADQ